jgi:hypothetical protein
MFVQVCGREIRREEELDEAKRRASNLTMR